MFSRTHDYAIIARWRGSVTCCYDLRPKPSGQNVLFEFALSISSVSHAVETIARCRGYWQMNDQGQCSLAIMGTPAQQLSNDFSVFAAVGHVLLPHQTAAGDGYVRGRCQPVRGASWHRTDRIPLYSSAGSFLSCFFLISLLCRYYVFLRVTICRFAIDSVQICTHLLQICPTRE